MTSTDEDLAAKLRDLEKVASHQLTGATVEKPMGGDFKLDAIRISRGTTHAADMTTGAWEGGGGGGGARGRPKVSEQFHVMVAAMSGRKEDGSPWNALAFSHPIVCICHDNQR